MASDSGLPLTAAALQRLSSGANDASGSPIITAQNPDQKADDKTETDGKNSEDEDEDDDDDGSSWFDSNGNELTESEKDDRDFLESSKLWHSHGDGEVCHQHESSFTDDIMFDMQSPHDRRLIYDRSTAQQLQRFVRDRRLLDPYPTGLTLKYYYIPVLVAADQQPAFRLMDLPPEIRMLIFIEMLTLEECYCGCAKLSCDAQILRTSRQVYTEANDILYARNTITCKFMIHTHDSADRPHVCASIHDKAWPHGSCPLTYIRNDCPKLPKDIPSFFLHIHSMKITIDCHGQGDADEAFGMVKNCLLNLCTVLMESRCLKRLEIHVVNHLTEDKTESSKMLWPLRRLRRLQHFELTGDVSDASKEEISSLVRAAEPHWPRHNTLLQCGKLSSEAAAFLRLAESIEGGDMYAMYDSDYDSDDYYNRNGRSQFTSDIRALYHAINGWSDSDDEDSFTEGSFGTAAKEERLRTRLDELRRLLQNVQTKKVERSLKDFQDLAKSRDNFEPQPKRFTVAEVQSSQPIPQSNGTVEPARLPATSPGLYLHIKNEIMAAIGDEVLQENRGTKEYDVRLRIGDQPGDADVDCKLLPVVPPGLLFPDRGRTTDMPIDTPSTARSKSL